MDNRDNQLTAATKHISYVNEKSKRILNKSKSKERVEDRLIIQGIEKRYRHGKKRTELDHELVRDRSPTLINKELNERVAKKARDFQRQLI